MTDGWSGLGVEEEGRRDKLRGRVEQGRVEGLMQVLEMLCRGKVVKGAGWQGQSRGTGRNDRRPGRI